VTSRATIQHLFLKIKKKVLEFVRRCRSPEPSVISRPKSLPEAASNAAPIT